MKNKWLMILLGLIFTLVVVVAIFCQVFLDPWLKNQVITQINSRIDGKFTVEEVGVSLLPPLGIKMEKVHLTLRQPELDFAAESLRARATLMGFLVRRVQLKIALDNSELLFVQPAPEQAKSKAAIDTAKPSANPLDLSLPLQAEMDVVVRNSRIRILGPEKKSTIADMQVSGLTFHGFDVRGPWEMSMESYVGTHLAGSDFQFPLQVQTELSREQNVIKTQKTVVNVAGLIAVIAGQTDLVQGSHDWTIAAKIPQLEKLRAPPQFLPPGKWTGSISAQVRAQKPAGKTWQAAGDVRLKDLYGDVKYIKGDAKIEGQLTSDAEAQFTYGDKITIPKFQLTAQLQQLGIAYGKYFNKPVGIPMAINVDGMSNNDVMNLKNCKLVLANLIAQAQGSVQTSSSAISNIHIEIPATNLSGFEKYFPILSGAPVQGVLQLNATAQGNLTQPESIKVQINPLTLKQARATINWNSQDRKMKVSGPVRVNLVAQANAQGKQLSSAALKLQGQFSGLSIQAPGLFEKRSGQPLEVLLSAQQKGQALNISQGDVQLPPGRMALIGSIRDWQRPALALKLKSAKISLASLSEMLPMLRSYKLTGDLSTDMDLNGIYDFKKGITQSALTLSGNVQAHLKNYVYLSPKTQMDGTQSTGKNKISETKPEPILPDWPILRTSRIASQLQVDEIHYNDLLISGVSWKGQLNQGNLQGKASVMRVFDGSIQVNSLATSLIQAQPTTVAVAQMRNLNIGHAVNWALPDWKDQIAGIATGTSDMVIPHPSRADFLKTLKAKGQLQVQNAKLSSLKFQQLAKDKLSKIPGVGNKANVPMDDLLADVSTNYNLQEARLNLINFDMKTPAHDELRAEGWIGLDKQVDLNGTAYLANAPVSGSVREANSDASGRLILPLKIRGNIMQPEVAFAEETIKQLIANTAKLEGKKLTQKIQQQGSDAIKKKGEETLKNLGNSVKGLFGH